MAAFEAEARKKFAHTRREDRGEAQVPLEERILGEEYVRPETNSLQATALKETRPDVKSQSKKTPEVEVRKSTPNLDIL